VRQKTELLLSKAHEINLYACLDVVSFRHVSLIEDAYWSLWAQISRRSFFLVFIVTCVKLLNSHVWNNFVSERMKSQNENQAEETYSSHKKICVVRISVTRNQSQFILNWGPCPPLVTPLPNAVYTFFYFYGLKGRNGTVPAPYASGCHSPQISSRSSVKLICNCREWC